ncbi:hypothetical protein HZH66_011467 [Vespula vulgaris]|uniref:Uncharacterized protein n=1 Tax=Vespula vulgaris TaxID=7454 RepID=A0A834MVR0_VESVU|nr:hypothetical protein HZH66_011467 [Vespula vulgaris]
MRKLLQSPRETFSGTINPGRKVRLSSRKEVDKNKFAGDAGDRGWVVSKRRECSRNSRRAVFCGSIRFTSERETALRNTRQRYRRTPGVGLDGKRTANIVGLLGTFDPSSCDCDVETNRSLDPDCCRKCSVEYTLTWLPKKHNRIIRYPTWLVDFELINFDVTSYERSPEVFACFRIIKYHSVITFLKSLLKIDGEMRKEKLFDLEDENSFDIILSVRDLNSKITWLKRPLS